jgi:hypothetical protein
MIPSLSTRAFKHLRKLNRKSGLQSTDVEIHDMGVRLLGLCHIAAHVKDREEKALQDLLTVAERKALQILRQQFITAGRLSSARELSAALGYKSSRSGHLLLQRLLIKGFLLKRGNCLSLAQE